MGEASTLKKWRLLTETPACLFHGHSEVTVIIITEPPETWPIQMDMVFPSRRISLWFCVKLTVVVVLQIELGKSFWPYPDQTSWYPRVTVMFIVQRRPSLNRPSTRSPARSARRH